MPNHFLPTTLLSNERGDVVPGDQRRAEALATKEHSRRYHVALLTNSVAMGGMERHVELLARHLDRKTFEIFTICPDWPEIEQFDETLRRMSDHHRLYTPDRRWGRRRQLTELWALARQLRAWRVDVLHMHLTSYHGGLGVLLAARLAGVPVVLCTEHLAPEGPVPLPRRLLRSGFLRLLDHLVCVSEKNCQDRARYFYTPPDRTSIVVNGVAPEEFVPSDPITVRELRRKLRLPEKAQVIGSVVRFVSEKGLNYLIDAMPAVLAQHPDTYLLLVGDGPLKGELEAQARRLGIRERVIFAGFHSDPRPYLFLLEIFVLPVPFGSMSIGLLEAMAMRLPVIITFRDREAVIHEETGLLAPPRDPEALARAIVRLLANPEVAHMYGDAARKRVEERFSAACVAHTLSTIYLACLTGRRSTPPGPSGRRSHCVTITACRLTRYALSLRASILSSGRYRTGTHARRAAWRACCS